MSIYCCLISICEVLKHKNKSKIKLIRIFNHVKYIALSVIENYILRLTPLRFQKNSIIREKKIIVSLTTYPKRINSCYYAIKSILLQTYRPDEIILWLAKSQFVDVELPYNLTIIAEKGLLTIRYCDDLRSHKKYYYILQEQTRDEVVITFDDDIIYHPKTIERALNKHHQYPSSIVANLVYSIAIDNEKGEVMPYTTWRHPKDLCPVPALNKFSVLTGSGCLYPYGALCKEAFEVQRIKELAFTADDLWITFMAMLSKTTIVQTDIAAKPFTTINNSQKEHLALINSIGSGNDDTVKRLLDYYPELKEELFRK